LLEPTMVEHGGDAVRAHGMIISGGSEVFL
jgi:hypothetical protein